VAFTIPGGLAERFVRRVPPRQRSRHVAEAIRAKLLQRDERLIRSCELANQSADVTSIEQQREAIAATDAIEEP
jgi:hypothetical protein